MGRGARRAEVVALCTVRVALGSPLDLIEVLPKLVRLRFWRRVQFASPVRRSLDARGVFLECLPEPHIFSFDSLGHPLL